jgi:Xaa-Pro aminopeptidase
MSVGPNAVKSLPGIDQSEFEARARRAAEMVREADLDAFLVHSNDGEMANVRYFSDYWPVFESAGVLIPADGEPALLIGPEAETFARSRSRIPHIYKLLEYREPADPEYPDIPVSTFRHVFQRHCRRQPRRIGIGGWAVLPLPVWEGLKEAWPEAEIVRADDIMRRLRCMKSPAEVACLAAAFRIAEQALGVVIDAMRPGMTELELVGVAQKEIYAAGAEYEGMPQYVLSGPNSTHAMSRASSRRVRAGEVVQLNISARVSGYSSGVGRPVCLGAMPDTVRELVEFGLRAHRWTIDHLRPGVPAAEIAREYGEWVRQQGYSEYLLYGPCHGLGIIEVEPPWVETTSCYDLAPGMTFQADNFFYTPEGSRLAESGCFGLRWEDGVAITGNGNMLFSQHRWECIELT